MSEPEKKNENNLAKDLLRKNFIQKVFNYYNLLGIVYVMEAKKMLRRYHNCVTSFVDYPFEKPFFIVINE